MADDDRGPRLPEHAANLQVVDDSLSPAERLAFVLHDLFELPFEEIAHMVGRTPVAARQVASRARRRVKGADIRIPDRDLTRQRTAVDAFFAAARGGDFDALVAVLDPDVVLRIDAGFTRRAASMVVHGAAAVASQTRMGLRSLLGRPSTRLYPALVNGAARVIVSRHAASSRIAGGSAATPCDRRVRRRSTGSPAGPRSSSSAKGLIRRR